MEGLCISQFPAAPILPPPPPPGAPAGLLGGGDWQIFRGAGGGLFSPPRPPPPPPSPPPPPRGNCSAFGGGALANLSWPGGWSFAYPEAPPDTHVVSDSKSKHGRFYRKWPAVQRRLACPSSTGQTCGGFLDFVHFFLLMEAQLELSLYTL